ncbi:hypothetical protein BT93_C0859 [Corymbia citriodora subsp. variegata]|nr:hypothetical protein BT93_C0859 [Corymbia citriodora subsp. variegata]
MAFYSSADIKSFNTEELRSLLIFVLSLAFAFITLASSQGIDFSFQTFNDSIIQRQDNATYDSSGFIQITKTNQDPMQNFSMGWATYNEPMRLWDKVSRNVADFTTQFTFAINSLNNSLHSDGMTSFLVPEGSQPPANSAGPKLALVDPKREPSDSSTWFVLMGKM